MNICIICRYVAVRELYEYVFPISSNSLYKDTIGYSTDYFICSGSYSNACDHPDMHVGVINIQVYSK